MILFTSIVFASNATINRRFIVRLNHFIPAGREVTRLSSFLWDDRYPASALDNVDLHARESRSATDFLLISVNKLSDITLSQVTETLTSRYEIVRDIHVDGSFRSLHAFPVPTKRQSNAKVDGLLNTRNDHRDAIMAAVQQLWKRGITGSAIKVAVFDTGVSDSVYKDTSMIKHCAQRKSFVKTSINDDSKRDTNGHGTFVAGLSESFVRSTELI